MEDSNCCEVLERDTTVRVQMRFVNGAIRHSVAKVESIAVSDVIVDKIYVVNKSLRCSVLVKRY